MKYINNQDNDWNKLKTLFFIDTDIYTIKINFINLKYNINMILK